MELETNLNVAPFFDDYDENKNFHRVLFRPGVPVQARELTQSQTILQDQIERFGQNIFKDGTIVAGANFSFDTPYNYVKVLDLQTDGQPVNASQYANTIIKNSANLTALVQETVDGLESQNPDLNTLYIKYINTGVDGVGVFSNSEVISAYTKDYGILSVAVADPGTGYSNSDIVVFTSSTGQGASARVITNPTGEVTNIVVTSPGNNYITIPSVSIANSTGGIANGSGVGLLANNVVGQLTVAANTFVINSDPIYNPTGSGYSFRVGEGKIFQKGFFIRVDPQNIIVSKYSTIPTDILVGFETVETIVNNSIDTSLLDNAQGSPNETAPGAFRLKLNPTLRTKTKDEATAANNFFALVEFQNGQPVKQKQTSEYNVIGQEMAKRTVEESGDYVISPFSINTDDITSNTSHFQARIGSGTAYVNGFRVQQYDTYSVPLRKGNDIQTLQNVSISTNYGNYVLVNRVVGIIPFNINSTVTLQDTIYTSTGSAPGITIGQARVRNIAFDSEYNGVQTYRLYLYDIAMANGQNFTSTKSIFYTGTGFPNNGAANLILENGQAILKESSFAPMVFRFGQKAIKTLRGQGNVNDTLYTYTTLDSSVNFAANGFMQKNLTGSDVFPYSGLLNDIEEREVIFVARNSVNTAAYTGTVNISNTTANVVGTGTSFLTNYTVGDYFIPLSGTARKIISIANNTFLVVESNNSISNTSTTYMKTFPANEVIPFTSRPSRTINASGSVLTATLGESISGTLNINAIYNVQRSNALQLTKNIVKNVFVKINTASNPSGPWCLGHSDIQRIVSVKKTLNADYITSAIDVTSHFTFDSGQKDTFYGLGYLRKKSTSQLVIESNAYITVTLDIFTHTNTGGGIGFYSVDSYPVNDTTTPIPTTSIRTQDIPLYISPSSGAAYDLRDAVDFRPTVISTANAAIILADATTNPSSAEVMPAVEKYTPAVNKSFITDLQYYQGRFDIVSLTSYGQYDVKEGVASDAPSPPSKSHGAMNIATVSIPPYPTLTTKSGSAANRPDYTVKISTKQNKRYTMEDIGQLDSRLNRVEYYTALTLLEKQTSDLLIPSSIDSTLDRFKNGIFVEPFSNFALGNVIDGEFTASIDEAMGELIPRFTQNKFDLQIESKDINIKVDKNNILYFDFNSVELLKQPYGTRVRNCTENYWNFTGTVELTPSYDNFYDVQTSPENTIVIDVDTAASTLSLVDSLNNIRALNTIDTTVSVTSSTDLTSSSVRGSDTSSSYWVDETYTTVQNTITTETKNMLVGQVTETVQKVGDFITDISFSPYIRGQAIRFLVTGLKPSTPVNAFFDKVKVTGFCQEAIFVAQVNYNDSWFATKTVGAGLVADTTGTLAGILYLPANTFFVGDRELKFVDVNDLNSESAASTSASGMFHAYNFSVTKSDIVVSTRAAEITNSTTSSTSTSTTRDTTTRATFVEVPTPPEATPVIPIVEPPDLVETNIGFGGGRPGQVDPLAQTFVFSRNQANNQEGLFITKADLYFQRKDVNLGLTVQLRLTDNGYPAAQILPMSSIHLTSSEVNISADGSLATTINFPTPIFLKADQEYAIVIVPDGNSPEYLVYTAQGGQTDLVNPDYTVRQDWGSGALFTSTNNSAWQSIQDEDLKFTLYYAIFNATSGIVNLTNKNDEFLTIGTTVNSFISGEQVFKLTTPITGNVSFSSSSLVVTGVGTSFQNTFVVGSNFVLSNTSSLANNSTYDVVTIASIASNTSLTLVSTPKFTASNVKALNTPIAEVFFYDPSSNELILTNSSAANNTFKFTNNDIIIGETLKGYTTIASVDNKAISYFQPLIYRTTLSGTNITGTISFANNDLQTQAVSSVKFNDTNYITSYEGYIGSKSNEITAGTGKSVRLSLNLTSSGNNITPTLDMQSSSILKYKNLINNDSIGENGINGNLISKYVSKTITLKDGLDAEDIKVYVTGYQPSGSEIEVYVRALNGLDPNNLRDKSWTKLQVNANTTSDSTNRNDFKEFEYSFANNVSANTITGVVNVSNTSVTGISTLFDTQVANGSIIQIGAGTNSFITKVASVTSNTSITIADASPSTFTGASIAVLIDPKVMFKNYQNDGVVTYYNDTSRFETYKTFAIKVGLKSSSSNLVPRLKDLSAIALSI